MAALNVTVKGGFWEDQNNGVLDLENESPLKRGIAQKLDQPGLRALRELMLTLNGAAAGSAALAQHDRIKARENTAGELGGLRTIETVDDVNRNTASADETNIDETILAFPLEPTTYPANGDGNPRGYPGG